MKTIFSWATLLASAAAICLFGSPANAQTSSGQPSGTNVAVIDLGDVLDQHPRLKAQMEDHLKDVQALQAELRQQVSRIESLANELKTLKPGTPDYAAKEKSYASMRADLQVQQVQKQREFLEREAKIQYNAYQEIVDHIKRFCQTYNIQMVTRFNRKPIDASVPKSVQMGLSRTVIFQDKLDITDHIIKSIQDAHPPTTAANRPAIPGRRR